MFFVYLKPLFSFQSQNLINLYKAKKNLTKRFSYLHCLLSAISSGSVSFTRVGFFLGDGMSLLLRSAVFLFYPDIFAFVPTAFYNNNKSPAVRASYEQWPRLPREPLLRPHISIKPRDVRVEKELHESSQITHTEGKRYPGGRAVVLQRLLLDILDSGTLQRDFMAFHTLLQWELVFIFGKEIFMEI